jgi:hypothetical protein
MQNSYIQLTKGLSAIILGATIAFFGISIMPAAAATTTPVTITVHSYMDGVPTTLGNAGGSSFIMHAPGSNGTTGFPGVYNLSPVGYGTGAGAYQAISTGMMSGDSFSTYENTSTNVGLACTNNALWPQYSLVGYGTGATLAAALAATPSMTAPSFTNMTGDMHIVVRNHDCAGTVIPPTNPELVKVYIAKYVNGVQATSIAGQSQNFAMNASWVATNIGTGSGTYTLSPINTPNPYMATTVDMTTGANYTTNEVIDGTIVGQACIAATPTMPKFALVGYTSGATMAAAASATPTMTSPALTGITADKYVIVWNRDCSTTGTGGTGGSGQIGGTVTSAANGVLAVTSVNPVDTSAIADGTFENGWKFVFNVTIPTNEPNFAMKFADWLKTGGGGTLPVANKMRLSSVQANNSGATVLLTAANVYNSPMLVMTTDLDPVMPGRQVQITVDVAVSTGTPDGAYTTTYSAQSN